MDNNWLEKLFINEAKPAMNRYSSSSSGGSSSSGSSSADFNIAYGDTPPEDTSKLWVRTTGIENVKIFSEVSLEGFSTLPVESPISVSWGAAYVAGTSVYIFGGYRSGSYTYDVLVFDIETGTLSSTGVTIRLDYTTYMSGNSSVVGSKVYVFGGRKISNENTIDTIAVFDAETLTGTILNTKLPTPVSRAASASVGTKIYVFGGAGSKTINAIYAFDTETNTITTLSTALPTAAYGIGATSIGSNVYLFGGSGSSSSSRLNTINIFDAETETISTLSTVLPAKRHSLDTVVVGDYIYMFGGMTDSPVTTIYRFNTVTSTISTRTAKLPEAAIGKAMALVGGNVYLIGGDKMLASSRYSSTISVFHALVELPENHLAIMTNNASDVFELLPNVPVHVRRVYKGNSDNIGESVDAYLYKDGEWTLI